MKRIFAYLKIAVIAALITAIVYGINYFGQWKIEQDRWAWYDAGYDDALQDMGIVIINGEIIRDGE